MIDQTDDKRKRAAAFEKLKEDMGEAEEHFEEAEKEAVTIAEANIDKAQDLAKDKIEKTKDGKIKDADKIVETAKDLMTGTEALMNWTEAAEESAEEDSGVQVIVEVDVPEGASSSDVKQIVEQLEDQGADEVIVDQPGATEAEKEQAEEVAVSKAVDDMTSTKSTKTYSKDHHKKHNDAPVESGSVWGGQ